MRIAILVANTDDSAFAKAHPGDGERFRALIGGARPDWQFSEYWVGRGEFPTSLDGIDGVIVTGSPASVHDADPWISRLMAVIRALNARKTPMFGTCFGHQAIAAALGGQVALNPKGWVLGRVETQVQGLGPIALYAAHSEQVTHLPPDATAIATTPGCPIAAFAIGSHVLTTQYHPEMTHDFMAALTDAFAADFPPDVVARSRASLTGSAEGPRLAEAVAAFFEAAQAGAAQAGAAQDKAASKSIAVT